MAAPDDAPVAAMAESVLSSILARNERLGKTSRLLGRMCFVGQLPGQQQRQLLAWHKSAVATLTTDAAPEGVTGLLLLYPAHFMHVIEVRTAPRRAVSARAPAGPPLSRPRRAPPVRRAPQAELSQLSDFAQQLVPLAAAGEMAREVRVLPSTDDTPPPHFPARLSSTVGQHSGGSLRGEGVVHVPMPARIADAYTGVLKLGRALGSAKKADRDAMLNDLRIRHAAALPTQEVLAEVSQADDALAVDEFVDIFCRPIDIKLDREVVWPIETEIVY